MKVSADMFIRFVSELRSTKRDQAVFVTAEGLRRVSAHCRRADNMINGEDYIGKFVGVYRHNVSSIWLEDDLRSAGCKVVESVDATKAVDSAQ